MEILIDALYSINMQTDMCQVPWLVSNCVQVFSPNNSAFRWQVSFSSSVLLFFSHWPFIAMTISSYIGGS